MAQETRVPVAAWTIQRTQCIRCDLLSCPVNRLPPEVREPLRECFRFTLPKT